MVTGRTFNIFATLAVTFSMSRCAPTPTKTVPERVYQVPFGRVLCGEMQVVRCGVHLSKCADTYEYRCLQNVRYEGELVR